MRINFVLLNVYNNWTADYIYDGVLYLMFLGNILISNLKYFKSLISWNNIHCTL